MRTRILTAASVALAGTFTIAAIAPGVSVSAFDNPTSTVFINEIHYDDSTGTGDIGEMIEVAGPAGTDLTGWSIVLYNLTGGAVYDTDALSGIIPDEGGGFGTVFVSYPTNGVQNGGQDGIALVDNGAVVQFLSYEGVLTATNGPASGLTSTDIGVAETNSTAPGTSLQLVGSGTTYGEFTWAAPSDDSPGAINVGQTFGSPPPTSVVINEFVADTTVLGGSEFVEILGGSSADTSDLTLLQVDGAGVVTGTYPLTATNAGGYELPDISGAALADAGMTLLVVAGLAGNPTDVDGNDDGTIDDPAPWTIVVDSVSVGGAGFEYTATVLADTVDGAARIPNGTDTDTPVDWVAHGTAPGDATITSGAANAQVPPPLPCPDAVDDISTIQGSGAASPCVGQPVVIEGIVVGDYEGTSAAGTLRGFYVQSRVADQDADPTTSEGIFVFNFDNNSVDVGDAVHVEGVVAENQGQTQIGFPSVLTVLPAEPAPAATVATLPIDLERYEGMLVTFPQELTVTELFQLGRFNQVTVSQGGRLDQPTTVVEPGAASIALQAENNLRKVVIDDASQAQNPDPVVWARGGQPLSAANTLRGGDTTTGATGVLTYTWGGNSSSPNAFRLRPPSPSADPTDTATFTAVNERPTAPPEVGGSLTISGFNVLNYFTTLDVGTQRNCGPTGFKQECRGAETAEELARQHDKLIAALLKIDADVFGFAELENTTGVDPLAPIVASLNAADGPVWAAVDTNPTTVGADTIGTDTIRVGVIYRQDRVTQAGVAAVLDDSVDPTFDDDNNRPTLAVSFTEIATGEEMTVVVNHWKSKGSCPDPGTPDSDAFDGAGCWNAVRTAAATAVVNWLADYPTGINDDDVLIFGDLNSYAREDPIDVLRDAGYVDLVQAFNPGAYSYVFDGQWGTLDYAFGSATLAAQTTGADDYHINADEPTILDYNTNFKSAGQITNFYAGDEFRTSDHDPAVVGIDLGGAEPTVTINQADGQADPTNGSSVDFTVVFSAPVTGFDGSDVVVTGTATTGTPVVTGADPGTTFTVTIPVNGDGSVLVDIPAGAANIALGAPSLASTSTDNRVDVDTIRPSVTVTPPTTKGNQAGPAVYVIAFSEPVTGLLVSELSVAGSTTGYTPTLTTADGITWTLTFTPNVPKAKFNARKVTVSVPEGVAVDAAGNTNTASTPTNTGGAASQLAE